MNSHIQEGNSMANSWDHTVGTEEYKNTLNRSKGIAEKGGYILNPDEERVEKVIGLMTMNFAAEGNYYCPCKQSHPLDTRKDVLCPCPEIKQEIDAEGMCFCKLFFI
ncbi:MAG: ferredoxin:thioredoxin reductase [Candidatus Sabulitectum sp.]|nr:ferredoxin:thioredoxin reductase [Candidatus Sabulitectum sp.]